MKKIIFTIFLTLLCLFFSSLLFADSDNILNIKEISLSDPNIRSRGTRSAKQDFNHVQILRNNKLRSLKSLGNPPKLNKGDRIKTDEFASAVIFIGGRTKIILDTDTHIKIKKMPDKIEAVYGNFFVQTLKNETFLDKITKIFSVETKYSITALLGTKVYFSVNKKEKIPDVVVMEGKVEIKSKNNSFPPIILNSYDKYVNGILYAHEKESMKYKGLGEGRMIYTSGGPSEYQGGYGGIYFGGSGQEGSMFRGIVFPRLGSISSSVSEYQDSKIQVIRKWVQKIENLENTILK